MRDILDPPVTARFAETVRLPKPVRQPAPVPKGLHGKVPTTPVLPQVQRPVMPVLIGTAHPVKTVPTAVLRPTERTVSVPVINVRQELTPFREVLCVHPARRENTLMPVPFSVKSALPDSIPMQAQQPV